MVEWLEKAERVSIYTLLNFTVNDSTLFARLVVVSRVYFLSTLKQCPSSLAWMTVVWSSWMSFPFLEKKITFLAIPPICGFFAYNKHTTMSTSTPSSTRFPTKQCAKVQCGNSQQQTSLDDTLSSKKKVMSSQTENFVALAKIVCIYTFLPPKSLSNDESVNWEKRKTIHNGLSKRRQPSRVWGDEATTGELF